MNLKQSLPSIRVSSVHRHGALWRGPLLLTSVFLLAHCGSGKPSTEGSHGGDAGSSNAATGGSTGAKTSAYGGIGGGGVITFGGATGGSGASATSEAPAVCGDKTLSSSEACEDGNANAGDGCSKDCKIVEEGFVCPRVGEACIPAQVCNDKKISGTENCDDGNNAPGDGCSSVCRVEPGYSCPIVGARCVAAECGDGLVAGAETCDDGQTPPSDGDGCSATCTIESPEPQDVNAWVCPTPGQPCVRTVCGDSQIEGTEQCDDGNNDTGDGCSPTCRVEPQCPPEGGSCKSVCGDGMILPTDTDQECDDGNSANGDGCSSTCTVEPGYECKDKAVRPTGKLILPIVFRDFKGSTGSSPSIAKGEHPDFEHGNGRPETGIVQSKLGLDGKPVHSTSNLVTTVNNDSPTTPDWFSLWYRDAVADLPTPGSPRYNYTFVDVLTLDETAADSGTFRFTSGAFFPLDAKTPSFGKTTGQTHNFHFTSEVRYWFQYSGNELLTFNGDDDVWVFVNKELAVDLGGIHVTINGSVQLHETDGTGSICQDEPPGCATPLTKDFGLELGKIYEIVVFQAERHTIESNYTLTLSAFNATRSSCNSVCGDGVLTPDEACDLGADKNTGEYGTCTKDCKLPPYCGDTIVFKDKEECDDGVNLSAYGYNATPACGPGCKLTDYCGDNKVDSLFGEQCDDGNHTSGDGCEANCTNRVGCGNGIKEPGEACDDGNTKSGDGCSEFCTEDILQ